MNKIPILESYLETQLTFKTELDFREQDKESFPWLNNGTRRYELGDEVGEGGRATAYKAFAVDESGVRLSDQELVVKVPNLEQAGKYTQDELYSFLSRQNREARKEWRLTRERLKGCKYANVIIDYTSILVPWRGEDLPVPLTVQPFLSKSHALSIDEFLFKEGLRTKQYEPSREEPVDNWQGIRCPKTWLRFAKAVALGLSDLHQRRIVHGDIWPPNIFITLDKSDFHPIFIDFGEAFPLEPKGDSKIQRDHAYRAPERHNEQSIVNHLSDVYSFGKFLLHLATGLEPLLPKTNRGHERREKLRRTIKERNHTLVAENPHIMDIICNCVSLDPIDRPSMHDVVVALDTYASFSSCDTNKQSDSIQIANEIYSTSVALIEKASSTHTSPHLTNILSHSLQSNLNQLKQLQNDVVILRETRERLLTSVLSLFNGLTKSDQYLSVTSPALWQGSALGLDGRYFTASRLAAARGAAIKRVFIVSVEELGLTYSYNLLELLSKNNELSDIAKNLTDAIQHFKAEAPSGFSKAPEALHAESQLRLRLVINSYFEESEDFRFSADHYKPEQKKSFLGLHFCSSAAELRKTKATNPVSIFHYKEYDDYLLMMTDCLGRTPMDKTPEDESGIYSSYLTRIELRGITVFRSVLSVPEDRINVLERIFMTSCNIGTRTDQLVEHLDKAIALSSSSTL
ncbi:protein kinase [bacterium]|nr:protein kinase [bacterium]